MGGILLAKSVSILHQVRLHNKPCLVAACPRWVSLFESFKESNEQEWISVIAGVIDANG
jgi:iron only hydrogenase large subunit-like protein